MSNSKDNDSTTLSQSQLKDVVKQVEDHLRDVENMIMIVQANARNGEPDEQQRKRIVKQVRDKAYEQVQALPPPFNIVMQHHDLEQEKIDEQRKALRIQDLKKEEQRRADSIEIQKTLERAEQAKREQDKIEQERRATMTEQQRKEEYVIYDNIDRRRLDQEKRRQVEMDKLLSPEELRKKNEEKKKVHNLEIGGGLAYEEMYRKHKEEEKSGSIKRFLRDYLNTVEKEYWENAYLNEFKQNIERVQAELPDLKK